MSSNPSTNSSFHIQPCTPADLPSLISIYIDAFLAEPVHAWCFPLRTCTAANQAIWLHERFSKLFDGSKPHERLLKAVETETGRLAAWTRWSVPHVPTEAEKGLGNDGADGRLEEEEREKKTDGMQNESKWPLGADVQRCEEMFGGLDASKAKHVVAEDMYVINLLATDPAFQRRGLGSMLLRHMLEAADREGKKAYIEATEPGHPVYLRLGWEDIDLLEFGNEAEGGGKTWVMMREPRTLE